jgi:hypothetical protein
VSALNSLSLHVRELHTIHFFLGQHESRLLIGPLFCLLHFYQPNWIMVMIVYVVNLMLHMVVMVEEFGVLKRLPFHIYKVPSWVILDFLQDPVCQHDLCNVICIAGIADTEAQPYQFLHKPVCCPQRHPHCVSLNIISLCTS